jgi:hypothetical protein
MRCRRYALPAGTSSKGTPSVCLTKIASLSGKSYLREDTTGGINWQPTSNQWSQDRFMRPPRKVCPIVAETFTDCCLPGLPPMTELQIFNKQLLFECLEDLLRHRINRGLSRVDIRWDF